MACKIGLDKLVSFFVSTADDQLNTQVIVPDVIKRKEFYFVPGSYALYALFLPWHGPFTPYYHLRDSILQKGYSCVEYEFSADILSPDYRTTEKCYKTIEQKVREQLQQLAQDYQFSTVNLVGASLSCVNALMIGNGNNLIKKIHLVVPGHCLAESLWEGVRTQNLRSVLDLGGVRCEQLKEYWRELAPENNIDQLQDKKIYITLSHADEVIPMRHGQKLVSSLQRHGVTPTVRTNRFLGHYATVLSFCYFPTDIVLD